MTRKRKIPLRICVGCRTKKPKRELIRLVRTPEGELRLDPGGKISGRGAYICRQQSCLEEALKGRRLEKNLRHPLSEKIIAEITALVQSEK
ncbi:MAG: YlxR family protein [Firmicutes bacterium]|jgi:predicted RNA-binding protein YlxR (DUF448 family)|nr:YlxR family protein [Bacillota bacterium]